MYVGLHQSSKCIVYKSMPFYLVQSLETWRHDMHAKVAHPGCCPWMPGMEVTFVDDFEGLRFKGVLEAAANESNAVRAHG